MLQLYYASLRVYFLSFFALLGITSFTLAKVPDRPNEKSLSIVPPDQQRYLVYVFYNVGYYNDPNFNWTSIETAIKNGCNAVELCVPWSEIYPTRNGPANWATLDKQIDRVVQLGAKVALRIGVHRDVDRVDSYWSDDNGVHTFQNQLFYNAHGRQFSLAHQPTLDLATDFVSQVAKRYSNRQQQGDILFMSVTNNVIQEQEYNAWGQTLLQADQIPTATDYSTTMIAGFRTWLAAKYTTVTALNTAWNSNYTSFSTIQPPGLFDPNIYAAFAGSRGKDWYIYRHKVHKVFVDQTTQAIKAANSSYKVINGHGSVFDDFSLFRGTLDFKNYALNTDGVKVDDAPEYPHRFSMDLVRSNIAPGKWLMNEVDGQNPTKYGVGVFTDQVTQSFQHGAKAVVLANFTDALGLEFARQICERVRSQGLLDQPVSTITTSGTIPLKLSQLIEKGYSQLGVQSQWNQTYNQNGNQPVYIPIDEDIPDINVVTTPPAATTTTPVASLSLLAPTFNCSTGLLTFKTAGGNGTAIEFMADGLKNWSTDSTATIQAYQRNGVTFVLMARQSGLQVTYNYTTNCPVTTNLPPVVVTPIANQTATLARSYSFVIPAATFNDPDGQVVSWAVANLPVGLTFDPSTRTISGIPSLIGPNVVTVTVTDNGGATTQTTFIIQILGNNSSTTSPASTTLTMIAPGFDCQTGKFIFRTTGGDGTPIEYFAVGIKPWSLDSVGTIDPWLRDGVTFTLQARQSGKVASYTFKTNCSNKAPVVVTPIANQTATVSLSYSLVIPATTFTDPDGQIVGWGAANLPAGLAFDPVTRIISGTPTATGSKVVTISATDNDGATTQTAFALQVLSKPLPMTAATATSLTMVAPSFDCATGRLVFRTTGGDGSPIEYFAVGIKVWSPDSVGTIDPWLRNNVTFILQARQKGTTVSYSFKTRCDNKAPVVVSAVASQTAVLTQSFSLTIPATTFIDPDGQIVSWGVTNLPAGLTFNATTHVISGTPTTAGSYSVGITVTDNDGASVQTTFVLIVSGNSNVAVVPTSPPLVLIAPAFDCTTGKLVFRSTGGNGTLVEYMATGIKVWSADSVGFIDSWLRSGVVFTLKARQSGKEITYSFTTNCGSITTPVTTTTATTPVPTSTVLTVVSPQSRIVYQRNQANQANVPVVGQAPSTATRAEARLVPITDGQGALLDWTNVPLTDAKTFATTLKHVGGWYRLEVRAWNGSTLLSLQTVDRVGIGEVFVIAGQSNAFGGIDVRPGANDDRVSCVDYFDPNVNEANFPIRFSHMDLSVSAGPNNPKYIWPELGDKLTSRLNVPVLFLGAAQSGTSSIQWRQSADGSGQPFPDYFPYRRLGVTLLHYIARTGARAVLWHQGEGDQGNSTQAYVDNLTVVINKSRQQTVSNTLPWVVCRATYVTGVTDPNIINAQNRLINEFPQVFAGPNTDVLGAAYRPLDNIHLVGIGEDSFINMWDQSLNTDFFSRSVPFTVDNLPQITTGYLLNPPYQPGQPVSVPYVVSGKVDATSQFSVQLIRDSDGSIVATLGSGQSNPMIVTLPANLTNGIYRAKVVAPNMTSLAGEPFQVGPKSGRVAAPEAGAWQVWPNPVEQELTVSPPVGLTVGQFQAKLSTVDGQYREGVIESAWVENGNLYLKLSNMPTGLYFLHIYDGDRPLQTLKVFRK